MGVSVGADTQRWCVSVGVLSTFIRLAVFLSGACMAWVSANT